MRGLAIVGLVVLCTHCSLSHSALETTPKVEREEASWNMGHSCENWITPGMKVPPAVMFAMPEPQWRVAPSLNPYGDTCMELLWDEVWWPASGQTLGGALQGEARLP